MTDQKRLTAESGNHTEQNTPVLSDLIARLGEATGPDRELDARLHEICIGAVWRMPLSGPWLSDGTAAVPAYTESIDAAMQLVPKGYDWIIGRTNDGMTIHACCGSTSEYFADTPPLALCIAALNSVREPSADGDPSLQRTLSEPLTASAPAGDGGEVKLLEWEEQLTKRSDEDPSTEVTGYEAETAFGTFYTVEVGAALFHVVYDYKGLGAFETEIAAKAAAQADYEQRIRSALYARPAPAVEVREALESAANWMQRYLDTFGELGDDATQANIDDWHALSASPREMGLMSNLLAKIRALPVRKEYMGGQLHTYVLLDNVVALVEVAPMASGIKPGPSEPSPSSRSETAGERALSQAEVRAGINILLETIAAKFDGWATWDVWRSEAASLVRSFKHAPPPSPDCSGCKPSGGEVQKSACIEGVVTSEGANAESGGAA